MEKEMKRNTQSDLFASIGCILPFVAIGISLVAGYLTHLFWVFETMMSDKGVTGGQFFLAVVGTLMPPAGFLHGVYLWFV